MNQFEKRKLRALSDFSNERSRRTKERLNTGLQVVRTIVFREPDPSKHRDFASFKITEPPCGDSLTEGLE